MKNIFSAIILLLFVCSITPRLSAQELFVYTEPASNMPARSIGIRVTNLLMEEPNTNRTDYYLTPEIMWGANKNLMLHVEGYFNNEENGFLAKGVGLYAKYRLYNNDKLYQHFRISAFGRASSNNGSIRQEEIMTNGQNSGYQLGLIGTQLLHKTAFSATVYYERALDNQGNNEFPVMLSDKAINYSLSAGQLLLPKKYTNNYKQTNINLMVEVLGQRLANGKSYVDIAPAIQFIFNSQTRVDIGYRKELYSNMMRTAPDGFLFRVEHLLFNVL